MADAGIRSHSASPVDGQPRHNWDLAVDKSLRALAAQGFYLDEFNDSTDDAKLTSAIAAQQAATDRNMPAIVLPCRPISFTTPRQLYNGVKIVGPPGYEGQKNPDISSGQYAGPEITLGGSISSGTSSWWNGSASTGDVNDAWFANFQVQGSQGSSTHQFIDFTSGGSMYPAAMHSLSFNFMRGVLGRTDRKWLTTQCAITGNWTINNCWDTCINWGGSDNHLAPAMMNIGVSQSASQTGGLTTYFMKLDTIELTVGGKIYISTMNGWRGILGSGNSSVDWYGGVVEGFKPTRVNGLLAGPGPGSQIKITGGAWNFHGTKIGQFMDNPDATEDGGLWISGNTSGQASTEVGLFGVQFYGQNLGTENAIQHTGGRLYAAGIQRRTGETGVWTGRPKILTTATAGTGAYTYSNPDQSLVTV
jgi:hypothetical protein